MVRPIQLDRLGRLMKTVCAHLSWGWRCAGSLFLEEERAEVGRYDLRVRGTDSGKFAQRGCQLAGGPVMVSSPETATWRRLIPLPPLAQRAGVRMQRTESPVFAAGLRTVVLVSLDSAAWFAAIYVACGWRLGTLRGDFGPFDSADAIPFVATLSIAGVTAAVTAICGLKTLLHRGRAAIGSFQEFCVLTEVVVVAGITATLVNVVLPTPLVPRTVPLLGACLVLILAAGPRGIYRAIREHEDAHPQLDRAVTKPVVIVGAGDAGTKLVDSMFTDADGRWRPVAFVDDDLTKRFRRHRGVRVLGTLDDLAQVADRTGAEGAVVAIRSGGPNVLNRVWKIAGDAIDLKVLPGLADLMSGVSQTTVRDVKHTDLLSRPQMT
jgi:FlaA1/EpsC-like NDP-sugar epimerase